MQIPTLPTGHLYQYITVLGFVIAAVTLHAVTNIYETHNALCQEAYEKVFLAESVGDKVKEFWAARLERSEKDGWYLIKVFLWISAGASVASVHGIVMWYWRIQRFEDKERALKNEKLDLELKQAKEANCRPIIEKP